MSDFDSSDSDDESENEEDEHINSEKIYTNSSRCVAHTLQFVVHDGLNKIKTEPVAKSALSKVKRILRFSYKGTTCSNALFDFIPP